MMRVLAPFPQHRPRAAPSDAIKNIISHLIGAGTSPDLSATRADPPRPTPSALAQRAEQCARGAGVWVRLDAGDSQSASKNKGPSCVVPVVLPTNTYFSDLKKILQNKVLFSEESH